VWICYSPTERIRSFGPPEVDVLIGRSILPAHPPSPGYKPLYGVLFDMIGDKDLRIPYEMKFLPAGARSGLARLADGCRHGIRATFSCRKAADITDDHIRSSSPACV